MTSWSTIIFTYFIFIHSHFTTCDNTSADWNIRQECWTRKGGFCVRHDKDFSCPFWQSVTWWKGCPAGYICCVPRRKPVKHRPISSQRCGTSIFNQQTSDRMIGRLDVKRGKYPWQAFIRLDSKYHCGGAIVSDRWIVTAAHCFDSKHLPRGLFVETGIVDLRNSKASQKVEIERLIIHEKFNTESFENDIALIRLKTALTLNNFSSAICLPRKEDRFTNHICTVSGWGWRPKKDANRLSSINLPVISYNRCVKRSKSRGNRKIYNNNICAEFRSGKAYDCRGDTGGPLACRMNSGQWLLAGVVSSSGGGCGLLGKPVICTKITSFLNWITKKTGMMWE